MALWLELIPKIHRSDQLDRRFHLLDDHDNETTFERDGTRQLELDETPVDERYFTATAASTSSSLSSTPHPTSNPFSSSRQPPTTMVPARRTSTSPRPATTPRRSAGTKPSTVVGLAVVELASANAPLSVTVAVGCALLLLNVAVFVVVCRQKRRAQLKLGAAAAARFRSRDELKPGGDTESACFDSNRSSVSSYSLAASVQHGGDYGRGRNVRFCEARAPAAAVTSQDGGPSAFAARRLPPRPGRDNDVDGALDNDETATSNHLNNPSTTV